MKKSILVILAIFQMAILNSAFATSSTIFEDEDVTNFKYYVHSVDATKITPEFFESDEKFPYKLRLSFFAGLYRASSMPDNEMKLEFEEVCDLGEMEPFSVTMGSLSVNTYNTESKFIEVSGGKIKFCKEKAEKWFKERSKKLDTQYAHIFYGTKIILEKEKNNWMNSEISVNYNIEVYPSDRVTELTKALKETLSDDNSYFKFIEGDIPVYHASHVFCENGICHSYVGIDIIRGAYSLETAESGSEYIQWLTDDTSPKHMKAISSGGGGLDKSGTCGGHCHVSP